MADQRPTPVETSDCPKGKSASRKKGFRKELREWIVTLAAALLVVLVLRTFVFMIIRVDGSSMNDTLFHGERMFVTVADVKFGAVQRGDVVICRYPGRGQTHFVKRVVAVPGDSVYRENGVTHVVYSVKTQQGVQIRDEALDPKRGLSAFAPTNDYEPYQLGADEYFVVGDNRYNSHDSRDWNDDDPTNDVGPIRRDMLVGRVRQVIWPLSQFRPIQ